MSAKRPGLIDPNQIEFGIIWQIASYPQESMIITRAIH